MAAAVKFIAKLFRSHSRRTASYQIDESFVQASETRKTDFMGEPQAIPTKSRNRTKSIPCGIVSKAAVIANLG
jgi:hypothetical protein